MTLKEIYSKFSQYCLDKVKTTNVKVDDGINKAELGQIMISPYLFIKSENIVGAFDFHEYDCIVFCETPIIDVLTAFQKPEGVKPSYNTILLGFNNKELMDLYYKNNMNGEELYDYCTKNNMKVKVLFSNILVNEKMTIFGVQYIPEHIREEKVNDILNFFKTCEK